MFWKKNWQRLFEKAIKKKRGNLNYKTHPVVLFSSVSVTKKRKGAEQRQCFKATHFIKRPSFQGQGVDLDTNIEGRIQENVRIVFTSKNNEMWLNIFFFFFSSSIAHLQIYRHIMRNWIKSIHILYADFFPLLLTMSSNGKPTTYPNDLKTKMQISYSYAKPQDSFLWHISKVFVNNLKEKSCSDIT